MSFITEFLQKFGSKSDAKFEEPVEVDQDKVLPNSEDTELPELDSNLVYYSIDFNREFGTIKELVKMYRDVATNHEVEDAIDEIINDSVVVEDNKNNIALNLDDVEGLSDNVKEKIKDEFDEVLRLLNFKRRGAAYFRKWYIDGRLWFQVLFHKVESRGILDLRPLSPLDITRVKKDGKIVYVYKEDDSNKQKRRNRLETLKSRNFEEGIEITEKNIAFVPSGLTDPEGNYFISHLHKAIKPLNQLKLLEDSAVIYRITRAPERRVFYIDVGKLPKTKAEAYVKSLMNKFKSSINYDVTTGKVSQNKKVMTMLEDFYLPTRGDTKGTKVETLQGGNQLGEIDDIVYFKKKLLKALKVPFSRLDTEDQAVVEIGRPGELTRPELKFQKFVHRLRSDFSVLFFDLLKTQLVIKNILKLDEWNKIKNDIDFVWQSDSYFTELKENEILSQRLDILAEIGDHIGTYFSSTWVKRNVLRQTDEEIKNMAKEIEQNKDIPEEDEEI